MLDLLRRVAVLTIAGAVAIGLLAPLTTRSATPLAADSLRLLAAADRPLSLADRAGAQGRERSAQLSLAVVNRSVGPESLAASGPAAPPSAPMEATLYSRARIVATPFSGDSITGKATWYCCSAGWRGEAVVALPGALGGRYKAPPATRWVTVCGDRCVVLPVVDYCGCLWGTSSQKVADLSPEAWAAVTDSPLSRGVVTVTVHLGG
ncbi:MAG TPA: hypothetical protein VI733_02785 [Candidatus Limnocylindria bacterium]|nr:hypothetical protein [Candidatus Limnocylindria bacterium]